MRRKGEIRETMNKVVHAYNCTTSELTDYSPFYLLFSRKPHLPIDLIFERSVRHCIQNHQKDYRKRKTYYDRKRQSSVFSPGDRVLVRNLSECGGLGKLRSYCEDQIHIVVSQKEKDSPVYEVMPECGTGRSRILHRNMLMPCNACMLLEEPA